MVAYAAVPAHALLRTEAARFHDVSVAQIVLVHECPRCGSDEHGRPRLLPTAAVREPADISLSRAGDLSIVALTDAGQVGVDIERTGAAEFEGFGDVALHSGERRDPVTDSTRAWVRKEALLKAYGGGLAIDPRDVGLDADGRTQWDAPERPPGAVWLRDLVVADHVGAVVVLPRADVDIDKLTVTVHADDA